MRRTKKINVNLASRPLRNRRFFFLVAGILVVFICVFFTLAGYTYWVYSKKNRDFALSRTQIQKKMQDVLREDQRLSMLIDEASQKYSDRIDFINTLIYKKSFSWVDFLSALEDSLPETCYVVSMAPSLKDNSKMEVRLKIAAPNLDELLKFNNNLYEKRFTSIRTISESRDETGMLISEISLIYERTV